MIRAPGTFWTFPFRPKPTDELLEAARREVMEYLDWVSHDWVISYPGETWDEERLEETIIEINGGGQQGSRKACRDHHGHAPERGRSVSKQPGVCTRSGGNSGRRTRRSTIG